MKTNLRSTQPTVRMNTILVMAYLIGVTLAVPQPLYYNEEFGHHPGIYFEKEILTTRTPTKYWKLVNYIDYGTLITNHAIIEDNLNRLRNECNRFEKMCPSVIRLRLLQNRMDTLNDSLEHVHELIGHRSKRSAPFEFIGSISKALFGTLTREDAQFYEDSIKQLSADNKKLSTLLANQTLIVKRELTRIEEHFMTVDTNFSAIHRDVDLLKIMTDRLARREKRLDLYLHLQGIIIMFDEAMTSHEINVNILIDGILFGKQGLIHPILVTAEQLMKSVNGIKEILPYAEFPVVLTLDNADDLIKASDISIAFLNTKLVIVMEIPLLAHQAYNAYTVHTLPFQRPHTNMFVYIQPQIKRMIVSQNDDEYYVVNELVPVHCKAIQNKKICKSLSPMRRIRDNDVCEVNLLLNRKETSNCKFVVMERNDSYWVPLQAKGKWLYSVFTTESGKVICSNEEDNFLLKGAGIISIPSGCKIRTNSITLINEGVISRSETHLYVPKIELKLDSLYNKTTDDDSISFDAAASQALSDSKVYRQSEAVSVSLSEIIEKAKEISTRNLIMKQPINSGHLIVGLGVITSMLTVVFALCKYKWFFQIISSSCQLCMNRQVETQNKGTIAVTSV